MSEPNLINKAFILLIILAFTLGFFTPVLADYIGPNRSVTTYEVEAVDYGVWARNNDTPPYCLDQNGNPADACIVCEWEGRPGNPCGNAEYSYKLGTRYEPVAVTTTYPAATVNGTLQNCTLQNGWCVTSPQLQITANEPVSGYHILLIEGIYNGEIFACAENPCTFPFATEGNHAIEYWALSSWGDSSTKKTTTIKVDTVSPNLNLLVNGTLGQNNWYVSDTTITAEGTDGTSGIYEKVLSIDNGTTWIPSTTLTDGVYQIDIKVTDNAYNVSTASTTISVDTTTPTLSLSISGTKGNNNYYVSKPKIIATTFDATSGIALVQAKIDNGNWIDASEITIEDGIHTYQFRVYDNAGNMTETPVQNIKVDTTPPIVETDEEINLGDILFFTLRDNGSGLWIERIVIEDEDEKYKKIVWLQEISGNKIEGDILWDGKFADKTLAGVGEYFITFKISDRAGNETFYTSIVNVNPISYLQSIPEFIPPVSVETSNDLTHELENQPNTEQNFGGEQSQTNEGTEQTFELVTGVSNGMASSNSLPAPSLILTGALALTAIATAMKIVNDAQKKREEEEEQSYQQAKNQAAKLNEIQEAIKAQQLIDGRNEFYASLAELNLTNEQLLEVLNTASTNGIGTATTQAQGFNTANLAQQQTAYDIYRQGEYQSVPIQDNSPFANSSVGGGGVSTTVPVNSLTNTSGSLISLLPSWFLPLVIGVTVLAGIVILDSIIDPRGHATNPSPTCRDSYAECFNQNQRLDFTSVVRPTGNNLDTIQFEEMLDVIYFDLNSKWRTPFDPSRMVYDTPFWNGNGRIQLFQPEYPDEILCLDGVCAPRSAINYTGVGMYSAHVGEPLWLGRAEVFIWNGLVWGNTATPEEIYFFEQGYNAYIERDANE